MIPTLYKQFLPWSLPGAVYIISDTHFNDPDCILMDQNWINVDAAVRKINSVVTKNDTLVILGDIGDESIIRNINAGYKVLVCGNHDKGASRYLHRKDIEIYDAEKYTHDDVLIEEYTKHPRWNVDVRLDEDIYKLQSLYYYAVSDNGLFDEVYTGPLMIGEKLLLSHEPISLPFVTNIHGHVHGGVMRYKNEFGCNCINVASDVCKFTPINLGAEIKNGLLADTPSIHRLTIDKRI